MNKKNLRQFLIDLNKAGYAGGEEKKWIKEPDGSTTIHYEKNGWRSCDNFFGGEPYGGRTVVFNEGKPVWIMVYYGWVVEGVATDPVYKVLRKALMQMPVKAPFRGPKEYKEEKYTYRNFWEGDVDRFSGEEQILQGKRLIYKANYIGGLVDQRSGA
ncbi:hypothetical protein KBI33_01810 [Candidatus Shapirobacteria bacterium]|nr:hypothetical protein [Candidatus Shapirobacteria bacterium]